MKANQTKQNSDTYLPSSYKPFKSGVQFFKYSFSNIQNLNTSTIVVFMVGSDSYWKWLSWEPTLVVDTIPSKNLPSNLLLCP